MLTESKLEILNQADAFMNAFQRIYYIVPTFQRLEITCEEQIIKNVIE